MYILILHVLHVLHTFFDFGFCTDFFFQNIYLKISKKILYKIECVKCVCKVCKMCKI